MTHTETPQPMPRQRRRSHQALFGAAFALSLGWTAISHAQTRPAKSYRPQPQDAAATAVPPLAAATLPPTPPTSAAAPIAATPMTETVQPAHRADVTFANGLLTVRANDSSLHQILRSISRQTGMKITGGVADPRVFGDYGPATPATILVTLIDGTGVNMLLRERTTDAPVELVLTPRTAGVSPPSFDPNVQDAEAPPPPRPVPAQATIPPPLRGDRTPQRSPGEITAGAQGLQQATPGSVPPAMPQPLNNVLGSENNTTPTASQLPTTNSVPLDSLPTPSTAVEGSGIVDSPNPPPAGSTTDPAVQTASPNGVKTPEQIYQMLLQMQQQQQAKPPQ